MDVTVCVATFGAESWAKMAQRAVVSVPQGVPVVHVHGDTLHEARNDVLALADTEFVCFLDADDELESGYFDAMATGSCDVRAPSVRYVYNRTLRAARMMTVAGHDHLCTADCLAFGNWVVIGAVARRSILTAVGGFRDFPVYEDWDLWARCWQAGATFEAIPAAVYRAHARSNSRNRGSLSQRQKHAVHQDIARANALPVPA